MEAILFLIVTLNCCFLAHTVPTASNSRCISRKYSQDSFVCVCDQNHCDTLNVDRNLENGKVYIYQTDRLQFRLHRSVVNGDQLKPDQVKSQFTLNLNRQDLKQNITGFGGCFTDGSAINIRKLSNRLVDRLMRDYFGQDGLEYNMGRIPIGGSDSSIRAYSLDDHEDDFDLEHFDLAQEDTKFKIPLLRKAKELNPEFRSFGSAWSSPAWMKTNHMLNGSGTLIGEPGGKYYKIWAQYYVKFLNAYKDQGIELWGLTTENEPNEGFNPNYPWNALGMTPENIRDFVKLDLGPALKAAGWGKETLKLMINDDNTNVIENYASVFLDDKEAAAYASGIAYHWYTRSYPSSYFTLARVHDKYPDYFLLSTEAGTGGPADQHLGEWGKAETIAADIIEGLNHWSTGWIDWALVVDLQGVPNWVNNWADSAIVVNETAQEYYKNPMYYTLAHFTKFLPIGSVRVAASVVNSIDNVRTSSWLTPDNRMVVIVLNANDIPVDVVINGFYKQQPIEVTLLPRSIQTFTTNVQ